MNDNLLAKKLKGLRKNKRLSQQTLAEISGLSLRTIQRLENENKNPSGDTLKRLSTALGVSPDYLIEWEPNENPNYLLIMAFSPILAIINSFLAIIAPLVLWSFNKKKIKGVNKLGVKIITIQLSWLIVYFTFRTLNFLRLKYILRTTKYFVGDELNNFLSDIETQDLLKTSFIVINVIITLFLTSKTYKNNQINYSSLIIKNNPS